MRIEMWGVGVSDERSQLGARKTPSIPINYTILHMRGRGPQFSTPNHPRNMIICETISWFVQCTFPLEYISIFRENDSWKQARSLSTNELHRSGTVLEYFYGIDTLIN